jgi:glycosyltransferase involved in cell wall biosynthesis
MPVWQESWIKHLARIRIGTLHYRKRYYTYQRTIVDRVPGCTYPGTQDVFSILNTAVKGINAIAKQPLVNYFNLNNLFHDLGLNRVDLLHLFNGVNLSKHHRWVTSFETIVPRLTSTLEPRDDRGIRNPAFTERNSLAFKALAAEKCKALLPLSLNARDAQVSLLQNAPAALADTIAAKMRVLHPPQQALIQSYDDKPKQDGEKIRFLFVGSSFFRKGGREILLAFQQLVREEHLPLELSVISSISSDDYTGKITDADIQWARTFIAGNPGWVTLYPAMSNEFVLQQMLRADVGLLPTLSDSYGFSILEFQAAGCPVITTNVRAIPEINNADTGWVIEVPKDSLGEARYRTAAEKAVLSDVIIQGLLRSVREICSQRGLVAHKGRAALGRVIREHDPAWYGEQLSQIYLQALR